MPPIIRIVTPVEYKSVIISPFLAMSFVSGASLTCDYESPRQHRTSTETFNEDCHNPTPPSKAPWCPPEPVYLTDFPPLKSAYSLKDWAYVWNKVHRYSHNSEALSLVGTESMEKSPLPQCHCLKVQPLPVSESWVWKDDPVEVKEKMAWQRSYSDFMHSVYVPRRHLMKNTKKQQQKIHRVERCRVWLHAHLGWLQ